MQLAHFIDSTRKVLCDETITYRKPFSDLPDKLGKTNGFLFEYHAASLFSSIVC